MDFTTKEQKIIEILETGPKAYTEIKELSSGELDNDSTLSRSIQNLKNYKFIEKITEDDPKSRYRGKYCLTNIYFKQKEERDSKSQFSKIISSRIYWQSTLNQLLHYLEIKYPILVQKSKLINFNQIFSDLFSYLVHFDILKNQFPKHSKFYFDLMLYLILNHPDQKYQEIKEHIQLELNQFRDQIKSFIKSKKMEEFSFNDPKTSKLTKFYLISDDPILYQIKQQIETCFSKFLLCWQLPNVKLEDHFDFVLQFSNYIFTTLKSKFNEQENYELLIHLNNNKICFMIYTREYILEQLKRIQIQTDLEIPFELLTTKQKQKFRTEYITSSQIFTSNDRKNLEIYFSYIGGDVKVISTHIEKLVKKINLLTKNPINTEEILYLKSHLLFLIRLFYQYNKKQYIKYRRELSEKYNKINFKYSELSKEIFTSIITLSIGLNKESEYNKRYFATSHFLERVNHLLNKLKKGNSNKNEIKSKINDIFDIASRSFTKNNMYPFFKKKCEIFLQGFDLFSESEILNTLKYLIEKYPMNRDIGNLIFWYLVTTKKVYEFENLIQSNKWNIYDKIYFLKEFIQKIPLEFDIEGFLNIESDTIKLNLNIFKENEKKGLITLLKILGIFFERINNLENAFLFYYIATELEEIALNPSKRDIMYKIFPLIEHKEESLKIINPAYFNLIKIFKNTEGNLNFSLINLSPILAILFKSIFDLDLEEEIENIDNSMPFLIKALECLFNFFKFDKKIQDLEYDNKPKIKVSIRYESDLITPKDKEILMIAKENLDKFLKMRMGSFLRGTAINIHFILNPIKNLDELLSKKDYNSEISYFQSIDNYNTFARLNIYEQDNHFLQMIKSLINLKDYNTKMFTFTPNLYNNIQRRYIPQFISINRYFRLPFEDIDYPFNLAFSRKYQIPENKPLDFWDRVIEQLESDPLQLIELLDIFVYHSQHFMDFEKLEKLSFLILKYYGIEWAIRYIDSFIEYIKWYNERLENPQTQWYPYTLEIEALFYYFDFHADIIKAKLYWEYRDRNNAKNLINQAYETLKTMKNNGVKLIGNFPTYERKLINLYEKLNQ